MRWLMFSAIVAVAVFSALNWRAQIQTQQKLDALTATLADRPAIPAPAPAVDAPPPQVQIPEPGRVPRELDKVTLPPYVIEAPDQLLIEVVVKNPKAGTTDRLPTQPISGPFMVRLDGTVGLGFWGSVPVTGLTLDQAVKAIRAHLIKHEALKQAGTPSENLAVIVDVLAYNSKRYYVITDGGGYGEQVYPFPLTGNETVLDALSNVNGLPEVAGKRNIWISRRTPHPGQPWQILPVDWAAITQQGVTHTNYQIMSGDRVYVKRTAP